MAIVLLIIILAILILTVVFAIQNVAAVPISLLFWQVQGSLALVLLVALVIGALIALLFALPSIYRNRREISRLRKEIASLEAELEQKTTSLEMVEAQIREKEQLELPSGAEGEALEAVVEGVEEPLKDAPFVEAEPVDAEEAPAGQGAALEGEQPEGI